MLALRYHGNKDIRLEEIPEPAAGAGEVRVRVTYTGICATDIEEWQFGPLWVQHGAPNPLTGRQTPLTLGHEITGHVESAGAGVTGVRAGDRVAINNVLTCGACFWCVRGQQAVCPSMAVAGLSADGGLAQFIVWPADMVVPLPDTVSDEEAALVEPATVAVRAVRNSGVKAGDTVAVVGAGTVGLLTAQAFRASGARVIAVDIREESLAIAKSLGADHTVNAASGNVSEELLELTDGIGPDIVAETAGAANTPVDAINWTRRGGTTVLVGIYSATPQMNFNNIVGSERRVVGSVAAGPGDMAVAVGMIGSGRIRVRELITAKVPLERAIEDGFNRMLRPEKDAFRILITPGG
ncbi:MAG: alcohol dehydrogenase catalytic domain-containing protein [Chloroflexi bacterium]|nr:alcohol dehydrogenase catalytic domain-containing protein [Chloroflexota bacterium]